MTRLRALTLALLLGGCSRGPTVILSVSNLPEATRSLRALFSLDGVDAREAPEFDLRGLTISAETNYRFGVRLPSDQAAGGLSVGVVAANEQGCLIGLGEGRGIDVATATDKDVSVTMAAFSDGEVARCAKEPPFIREIEPGSAAASAMVPTRRLLRGWGFTEGVVVGLSPLDPAADTCQPQSCPAPTLPTSAVRLSPTEVQFDQPAITAESGFVRHCVVVDNPGGPRTCQRMDSYRLTFAQAEYAVGAELFPTAIVAADLDGDGAIDLALSALRVPADAKLPLTGAVLVLKNDGSGRFAAQAPIDLPVQASFLVAADFDKQRGPDLLVSSREGRLFLLTNQGGRLAAPGPSDSFDAGDVPDSMAVADFDRDGFDDVAVVNDPMSATRLFSTVTVLRNGAGVGPRLATVGSYLLGTSLSFVHAADLNGDGFADLAGSTLRLLLSEDRTRVVEVSGGLGVLLNQRDGTFPMLPADPSEILKVTHKVSGAFADMAIGDLNGDGRADVAVTGRSANGGPDEGSVVSLLLSKGSGVAGDVPGLFSPAIDYTTERSPFSIVLSDLDRDGRSDVVVAHARAGQRGSLEVLRNLGGGKLPRGGTPLYDGGKDQTALASADFNGDGKIDLALANLGLLDKTRVSLEPGTVRVFLNTSP